MSSNQFFEQIKSEIILNIERKSTKDKIEKKFYDGLAKCLESKQLKSFRQLIDYSYKLDIFIDVRKIPNRYDLISNILMDCIHDVSAGYQTSALGKIIDVLRFCNELNLFDKDLDKEDFILLERIKKDNLLLSNLKDLFGVPSNSFLLYINKVMPQNLYNFFLNNPNPYFQDPEQILFYIKNNFFNQYTIYGLSVKYLSSIKQYIKEFQKHYLELKKISEKNKNLNYFEFKTIYKYATYYYGFQEEEQEQIEIKKHLISPENVLKNLDKIMSKDYNFYILSMVLLGGIGPQGHGFTYSTPKGEVIEICSDIKENDAIIIKYKQFLKQQFLVRLEKEMKNLNIDSIINKRVIDYLLEVMDKKELINYYKKEGILKQIKIFLNQNQDANPGIKQELYELINTISNAINIILRPITMIDQFKARMDLIAEEKIQSEDIAKLTSLKEKSHHDVLRERLFFQYIVDWFFDIHVAEKSKFKK